MNLRELYDAPKQLATWTGWTAPERETGYAWFNAPLDVEGVTQVGFVLSGGCYPSRPHRNLVFELRLARIPGRKMIPLARFEWRSDDGGHTNPLRKGSPHSGKRVGPTHLHPFGLNYSETEDRMKLGSLRIAVDAEPEPADFSHCLHFVGKAFQINNMEVVAEPDWAYDLFAGGNDG